MKPAFDYTDLLIYILHNSWLLLYLIQQRLLQTGDCICEHYNESKTKVTIFSEIEPAALIIFFTHI